MKPSPITQFYDTRTLGQCELEKRGGVRCERSAAVEGRVKVLDLFSGIGSFSLGLEAAGMRTVAFCEINPKCRAVLEARWPDVPIHEDIKDLDGKQYAGAIDVVCGGFPCQPFSTASAGKQRGKEDDRFLWPEMRRVIEESEPTWVIGENVAGIAGLALEQVVSDLEALGYEVQPLEIPACAVGHDHKRSRYWFLGYSDRNCKPRRARHAEAPLLSWNHRGAGRMGTPNGPASRMDRLHMLGNSLVPEIPEIIGRTIMSLNQ